MKTLCQHRHKSAFIGIEFGANDRGIFGATPTDLMHAFLEGVVKYIMREFGNQMTPSEKAEIDYLVDELFARHKSSEHQNYPRTNFTHGFTNLTQLTAEEWPGMVLTLLILNQFERGREILATVFEEAGTVEPDQLVVDKCPTVIIHGTESCESGSNSSANSADSVLQTDMKKPPQQQHESNPSYPKKITATGLVELLETILAFHAFYKRGNPFVWDDQHSGEPDDEQDNHQRERYLRVQVQELLSMIVNRIPREEGHGWALQKFHELLHIPHEMTMFGSPSNWDAGPGESSLKYWAKMPAMTALKWSGDGVFTESCARRLHEKA